MRAFHLVEFEGPDALELVELPEPTASKGSVVINVKAIGINFPDLLMTQGSYQLKPPLPFVPGCEVSGTIVDVPRNSTWQKGDRVATFVWSGGYSERVAAPAHAVFRLPGTMDFSIGAATIVNYHTVHFALARRGRLARGETLLVLGAAGGIGSAAVQVGKALGARVIGGVANSEQLGSSKRAGADDVLVLSEGFSTKVRKMTDNAGVDVVLDPLGDWIFGEAVRTLAPAGRILVVGFAAGDIPTLKVNRLLLRNIDAVGVGWGAFLDIDPNLIANASQELGAMFSAGTIRPLIGRRYRFEQIPEALHQLSQGQIQGKGIVDLAD
jgi:NADPH2:quinone reductase